MKHLFKQSILLLLALLLPATATTHPLMLQQARQNALPSLQSKSNSFSSTPSSQIHQVQSSELQDLTGELLIVEGGDEVHCSDGFGTSIQYDQLWISYTGDEVVEFTILVNLDYLAYTPAGYGESSQGTFDLLNDDDVSQYISWDAQNNRYIVDLRSLVFTFFPDDYIFSCCYISDDFDFLVTVHADGYNDLSGEYTAYSYHNVENPEGPYPPIISDPILSDLSAFITVGFLCSCTSSNAGGQQIDSEYDYDFDAYAFERKYEDYYVTVSASNHSAGKSGLYWGNSTRILRIPARECGISISRFLDNDPKKNYLCCIGDYGDYYIDLVYEYGDTIDFGEKESFTVIDFNQWLNLYGYIVEGHYIWECAPPKIRIDGQPFDELYDYYYYPVVIDLLPYGDAFGGDHHIEVTATEDCFALWEDTPLSYHPDPVSADTVLSYHPIDTCLTPYSLVIDVNSGMGGCSLFVDGEEVELSSDGSGVPAHIYALPRQDQDYSITVQVGNAITNEYDGEVYVLYQGRCQETTIIVPAKDPVLATSIEISPTTASILQSETLQLTTTVLPDEASNKAVAWASNNPAVAAVDENGLVTAYSLGSATITAMTTDGSNLSASCVVTVTQDLSDYDNYLLMPDTTVFHGDTIVIPVQLNNEDTILAFQTDIVLPNGFSIVSDADGEPLVTPSSRLTSDHVMMADHLSNGRVRVICYSLRSKAINGNEGDLFYITVAVPEGAEGDYIVSLRNSLLTASDYTELNAPVANAVINVYSYIPGDVNNSRTVTVTDIVYTAQYILQRDPSPFIFAAADMNNDGSISVTDVMLISNLIMTPTMNVPKRMPALEANSDRMSGEDITLAAGETKTVSIVLDNALNYTAFQLDMQLPDGLTAGNFQVTDRAGNHAFDVNAIGDGLTRALCYSPAIDVISGHSGALLTFEVTATGKVQGDITVNGIELVTADCQTVKLDAFTIGVNNTSAVNELTTDKTVARVDYFNMAGQQIDRPESGVTLVVTTYTDGTRITTKVIR